MDLDDDADAAETGNVAVLNDGEHDLAPVSVPSICSVPVDTMMRLVCVILTAFTCAAAVLFFKQVADNENVSDLTYKIAIANVIATSLACICALLMAVNHSKQAPSFSNGHYLFLTGVSFVAEYQKLDPGQDLGDDPLFRQLTLTLAVLAGSGILIEFIRRYVNSSVVVVDDGKKGSTMITPETTSSIFSLLSFSWLTPLFQKGRRQPLTMDDLWQLRPEDSTEGACERFHQAGAVKGRSLLFRLFLTAWKPVCIQYFCSIVYAVVSFSVPFFMNLLLNWLKYPECERSVEIYAKSLRRPAGVAPPKAAIAIEDSGAVDAAVEGQHVTGHADACEAKKRAAKEEAKKDKKMNEKMNERMSLSNPDVDELPILFLLVDGDKKDIVAHAKDATKLVQEEEKETGSVNWDVYMVYFRASGLVFAVLIATFIMNENVINFVNDWWLSVWTNQAELQPPPSGNTTTTLINTFTRNNYCYKDWQLLAFADENPLPEDDEEKRARDNTIFYIGVYGIIGLSKVANNVISLFVAIFSNLKASRAIHNKLVTTVLNPLRFFEVTPLGRLLNRFSKDISSVDDSVPQNLTDYLASSRELKRLQSVTRSPILSHFSETLNGVTTIRAYGQTKRFLAMNNRRINDHARTCYLLWASNRWLNFRAETMSAIVMFVVGSTLIDGNISSGIAGMILLYASSFSESVVWIVRQHAEMEMGMNSVERCREYFLIEQEPPAVNESYRPGPNKGEVIVKNLSIRYAADQPLVLKNITFSTRPGEKVGIVGRTGAGKSTLSLAFFRIIPCSTQVLENLSQTGAVADDSASTNDTADDNKSPTTAATITSSFTLDAPVTENGGNFSQGQRQLLCMARALLRKSRLIFLDEATASIDTATDERIQKTIREELTLPSFVLLIVFVPLSIMTVFLYWIKVGSFRKMCDDTGEVGVLLDIARNAAAAKANRGNLIAW
ncbi:hypothetical protein HDU76_012272 [Blyttiomyces sp. JEL0837]|nr:hypothetical protein HDU76_012272 [Blyttiomyces sp. JEL0837]